MAMNPAFALIRERTAVSHTSWMWLLSREPDRVPLLSAPHRGDRRHASQG